MTSAPRPPRLDALLTARWLTPAVAALLTLAAISVLARPSPLGNDEAQYALGARGLLVADVDPYPLYRSVGMRVLAVPGVAAGGADWLVRAPFVGFALGYLALVARAARCWAGPRTAGLAVLLQVGAAPWLVRAFEALSDIPTAALLLAIVLLITDDAERPRAGPGRWLAIVVLAALAVYVRYGSAPTVAAILAGAALVYPTRRRAIVLAGTATIALLGPFLLWSAARTGSAFGVLRIASDAANQIYPGEGLIYYATRWPWALAGPLMGVVVGLGAAVGLHAWRRGGAAMASGRVRRLLVLVALAQGVLLGARAHGEPRYVFFATTVLAIVGAGWLSAPTRVRLRAVTTVLALASVVAALVVVHVRLGHRRTLHGPLAEAARQVGDDVAGRRCIVYTGTRPQVGWYAGCRTQLVGGEPPLVSAADGIERVYLLAAAGAPRQPTDVARLTTAELGWDVLRCTPSWCVWLGRRPGVVREGVVR